MKRMNKTIAVLAFMFMAITVVAQEDEKMPDTQVEPQDVTVAESNMVKDSVNNFKRIKLDGISAVVGDYVILDSDVEKTLIDLKSQGVSTEDITHCGILGKLMEDRLYAHQAVQDSILVSDDEVNATSDRQIQGLVGQIGSLDKVLKFYKKEDIESFKLELYEINKLRMLSEKMQNEIIMEVEVTPEEIRQFFNKIPEDERPVFGAELEISQIVKVPKASEEEVQKVKDRLNAIRADVLDNGSSFKVKAILYTQDPGSKATGGFYKITKETGFVKEFKDVAFSLGEGEVSEPFETIFGYHIIQVEKIRGLERDIRHILIKPEISTKAVKEVRQELDSIRLNILDGKFTFAEAALNFSDEKETKYDGGVLRNPRDFGSRFELTNLDPTLYNQIRDLKDDEISRPVMEDNPREGVKYKIYRITNRYDEHVADFAQDYLKIQELALTEKRYKAIKEWMDEHIEDAYISVNESNRDCDFANDWVKE